MARHNLYMFRCDKKLTKAEMAAETGVSRTTYTYIESGKRDGSQAFWSALQSRFDVPDENMYTLMKKEKGQKHEEQEKGNS